MDKGLVSTQHIVQQTESVKASAKHIEKSVDATQRSADQTTVLAADRTLLAVERTYAAWIRTGLAALISGVGTNALLNDGFAPWFVQMTGSLLIVLSMACFGAAIWRVLKHVQPLPVPTVKSLPPAPLVGITGLLGLIDVFALIGIWAGHR